ncbi:laccase [Pleurotus pulmonarius]|nr:laccase [Pleurotus pulmonarius]KAF4582574.1 laccase [Pleurotus pulmonarius]
MSPVIYLPLLLSFLLSTSHLAAAIGPTTDLHIVNKVISPDGFSRSTVLAGATSSSGQFPGPLITGNKGDHFQINVIDELVDKSMLLDTSIHWHGFYQKGSSWADGKITKPTILDSDERNVGPAFVTQCPIVPGDSFLYSFSASDQAGTFWYHSHLSTQYCDGLRGAFVVYDPEDPHRTLYDVDDENTVITLADWYHTPAPSAGPAPVSEATLINGLGLYQDGPSSPLAVIHVKRGSRYRFRLVSISCDPNHIFSVDGHNMTIIEVDSVNTRPLVVDSIQVFPGQRYSFVLYANQKVDNYWIRASPNLGPQGFAGGLNSAILRYVGAPETNPSSAESQSTHPMLETNLVPLESPGAPGPHALGAADVSINLDIAFDRQNFKFTINGVSYVNPTAPVLLQILSGAMDATSLLPAGSVYVLPPNKVIEVSIPGLEIGGPVRSLVYFKLSTSCAGSSTYNFANPVRRDVVSTGTTGDNVTIRFTTDNAGPWLLHCHIDWHLELGLAIVFAEDTSIVGPTLPYNELMRNMMNILCDF